jgi:alkaline phosphatase
MLSILVAFTLVFSLASLAVAPAVLAGNPKPVKNIIYFIGDGMGPSHVGLTRYYSLFVLGNDLNMTKVMNKGSTAYITNYSASHIVTDSAAAGTALATGYKTNNGMVSMLPDGKPVITILEKAQQMGKSTGNMSTTRLTHATPACFAAHNMKRGNENEIAVDMLEHNVTVQLAGGRRNFIPQSEEGSKRKDDRDLLKEAKEAGYTVVKNAKDFRKVDAETTDKLFGLFTMSHMSYDIDRDPAKEPSLADMVEKGIEILSKNPKGFFLHVEGGRIDHDAHNSGVGGVVGDTLAFDAAVGVALEYQKKDPNTLVVVTADHETGGLAMTKGHPAGEKMDYMTIKELRKIKRITASNDDVIAKKCKKAPNLAAIKEIVKKYTAIEITDAEAKAIKAAKPWDPIYSNQPANCIGRALQDELKVVFATGHHSAEPLMLFGVGPYSEKLTGFLDNTDIPKIMSEAFGTGY